MRLDPTFALGHATVALLAAEYGDRDHAKVHLHLAERNIARASARERSAVHALGVVCTGDGPSAFKALVRHLTDYPSDALLLDVAFPTIAFSGVTETSGEVWSLVEGAAPAYGDDWFYLSLLSFVRQEQERYDDALALAERALAIEPFSGHAVHAAAHVHYETSDYAGGLDWLDGWLSRSPDDLDRVPQPRVVARRALRAVHGRHRGGAAAVVRPARPAGEPRAARPGRCRLDAAPLPAAQGLGDSIFRPTS